MSIKLKENKSQQYILGTIIIFTLLLCSIVASVILVNEETIIKADKIFEPLGYTPVALEDFTTYDVCNTSFITLSISTNYVNFTNAQDKSTCRVLRDMGIASINDFTYSFTFNITSETGTYPTSAFVGVSPDNATMNTAVENKYSHIMFYYTKNTSTSLIALSDYSGTPARDNTYNVSLVPPFTYYVVLSRSGTTATASLYNDSAHTELYDTLTITCNENLSRYVYALGSYGHTSDTSTTNGYVANLNLTYGQSAASSYTIKGLQNNRITWYGTAGQTVFCNSSGDYNEWPEINISANSSTNVTEIRVWVGDLNNTGPTTYVNASNVSLYVSSNNASYGLLGTFLDGGSNLSINTSTWNAGTMGTNPFLGQGINGTNTSIYCIFKVTIPSGLSVDVFYALSSTNWKIYIGRYL